MTIVSEHGQMEKNRGDVNIIIISHSDDDIDGNQNVLVDYQRRFGFQLRKPKVSNDELS